MSPFVGFIFSLLFQYKYFILFPGILFEGPILTMLGGFLASPSGGIIMNVDIVFIVAVLADLTGDVLYYSIGRFSGSDFIEKYRKFLGLTQERLSKLKHYFERHGSKTIILGKISHGLGWPAMVAAGAAHMRFGKFMTINTIVSLGKTVILVALGYYYGKSSETLFKYVGWAGTTLTILVFGIAFYVLYAKRKDPVLEKEGF
ncbi:MAG: DedA family protein [Candidatus Paceibacterota bacterium]|jgi:membrane protein DedA with SNARE-associated domain